jgi:hypothetical protein
MAHSWDKFKIVPLNEWRRCGTCQSDEEAIAEMNGGDAENVHGRRRRFC